MARARDGCATIFVVPIELRFHHGGVSVPDLEASIRWYREVLGFEVEHRYVIPKPLDKVAMLRRRALRRARSKGACWQRGALRMVLFEVENCKPLPGDRRVPAQHLQTHFCMHVCFVV